MKSSSMELSSMETKEQLIQQTKNINNHIWREKNITTFQE